MGREIGPDGKVVARPQRPSNPSPSTATPRKAQALVERDDADDDADDDDDAADAPPAVWRPPS